MIQSVKPLCRKPLNLLTEPLPLITAWLETRRSVLVDGDGSWIYVDSDLAPCGDEAKR